MRGQAFGEKDDTVVGTDSDSTTPFSTEVCPDCVVLSPLTALSARSAPLWLRRVQS